MIVYKIDNNIFNFNMSTKVNYYCFTLVDLGSSKNITLF